MDLDYPELIAFGVDVGMVYLFYKLYENRCQSEIQIKKAPHYNSINKQLYQDLSAQSSLPYVCVEGCVEPINKLDTLKSRFGDDLGAVRHTQLIEHTSKRQSGYWVDRYKKIKDYIDKVPFKLQNAENNKFSIDVEQPMEAHFIEDELKVVYDNFKATDPGILKRGLDRVFGEVTKGYQERERMLTTGTTLLGIGRISQENGGRLVLEPPLKGEKYILTRMSKKELLHQMGRGTMALKVAYWIFGGIAAGLAVHYLYSKYNATMASWREQEVFNEIRERANNRSQDQEGNGDMGEQSGRECVVCLQAERTVILLDCGHICLCVDCAEALPRPKKCPVCRSDVLRFMPTYNP